MTNPAPSHPLRSASIFLLKLLVSAGLLYFLFRQVDVVALWATARTASPLWLAAALGLYLGVILLSAWRWALLLGVQRVHVSYWALTASYLVATFFNNFLPSNIGGDVIRIRDTARITGSKTLATTVILLDRGVGLLGLVLVAALGATAAAEMRQTVGPVSVWALWAGLGAALAVAYPFVFAPDRIGQLLRPLRALHPEWFGDRINRFTAVLSRFRGSPRALANCFIGAMGVQAVFIAFYAAIASSLGIHVAVMHLAILVPLSFVIQMVPLSVNGFGVRETVFVSYLSHVGIPKESALLLSLIGAALIMVFSVSGAITYVSRRHH